MIRKRASLFFGAVIMAFVSMFALAGPAAADQVNYCSIGGYAFTGQVDFNRPGGGSIVFNYWTVNSSGPLEYRVRWYTQGHLATPIYDTGYSTSGSSYVQGFPGVSRYMPNNQTFVLINAGRLYDGYPTCEIPFTIPAP